MIEWLFGVLALVAVGVTVWALSQDALMIFLKRGPAQPRAVAREFLVALRDGQVDAAYARLAAEYRAAHDVEAFRRAVAERPPLGRPSEAQLVDVELRGETAQVTGVLAEAAGATRIVVDLAKRDGQWCVTGVTVGGRPLS